MIEITINNSTCQLKNVPKEAEEVLKNSLKYLSQNVSYKYHNNLKEINRLWIAVKNDSIKGDKTNMIRRAKALEHENKGLIKNLYKILYVNGEFPTGLLPKALEVLKENNMEYDIIDSRRKPETEYIKHVLREQFPSMRYYQRTASRIAKEKGRGIIVAPTGTGKTLTVAKMIWELGVKTLIITPSKSITDNMVDTLVKYFGKGKVDKLTTKSTKLKKDINVVNIQAMVKIDHNLFNDIDMVIIDEFHHAAAETYQEVNLKHLKNCYFRIGVTATNFRNDGSDLSLEGVLSEVIYEYTIEQALKDEFLVKPTFEFVETEVQAYNHYQKEYKYSIVENKDRNDLIGDIADTLIKEGKHILILVQQVEHGETLKSIIKDSQFIHGEEKDSIRQQLMDDYREGKIKCLIGTSVIGEGVDLPIADVLIMAGGGKARSQIMQNVGRVLRPFPNKTEALIVDFTDDSSNYLSKHAFERNEIYKQYEVKDEV